MLNVIEATTIDDAWRQAIYQICEKGRVYKIDTGSFEGHQRLEFYPLVVISIQQPGVRPLEVWVPEGGSIPAPSSEHYTTTYLDKLINPDSKFENEDYVYAQYVWPQLGEVIEKFRHGAGTNQATITVGDNESIFLNDPPCLKLIDFRLTDGTTAEAVSQSTLDMFVYFRSWDLWAGFPNNLAALELLREYVMEELPYWFAPNYNGKIIGISKGLHLYDYCWPYAEALNNKPIKIG